MIFLIAILTATPPQTTINDHVDLIEVNHYFDSRGKHIFDQVIFYEWSKSSARFHVTAWRMLKTVEQIPRKDWRSGLYVTMWRDGKEFRRVEANGFRETWTQYDPELVEREFLSREHRRGLTTHEQTVRSAD